MFLAAGLQYAFGVVFRALLLDQALGGDRASISWVISIQYGFFVGVGVLAGKLTVRLGPRAVALLGATLASLGFATSSIVGRVDLLYVTYGVLVGTGCGFLNQATVYTVSAHFVKQRALAIGVALSGSGVGSLVLAPALELLIQAYGWRGALRVLVILTAALVPVSSLPYSTVVPPAPQPSPVGQEIVAHGEELPARPDAAAGMTAAASAPCGDDGAPPARSASRRSAALRQAEAGGDPGAGLADSLLAGDAVGRLQLRPRVGTGAARDGQAAAAALSCPPVAPLKVVVASEGAHSADPRPPHAAHDALAVGASPAAPSRPGVEAAVGSTALPEQKRLTYVQLLGIRPLRWFLVGLSLYAGCFFAILQHLVVFATEAPPNGPGLPAVAAATLVSYQGVANTVGRLVIGRIADTCAPGRARIVMQQALLLVAGLAAAGVAAAPSSVAYITFYVVIFGSCAGSITATSPAIVADLVPAHSLALGLGLQSTFQSPLILLMPPVAGWVRTYAGSYQFVWAMLALQMCLGSLLMAPETTLERVPRALSAVGAALRAAACRASGAPTTSRPDGAAHDADLGEPAKAEHCAAEAAGGVASPHGDVKAAVLGAAP